MTDKVSFSRVECWKECPRKYKYRYIDKAEAEEDLTATNPLILGSALDKGIEHGVDYAIDYYYSQYPIITDAHVTEAMKLEYWIPEVRNLLRSTYGKGSFQTKIESDRFIGFADYITNYDIIDFKYSNHVEKYRESPQISIYASELGTTDKTLSYICIPKTFIRQKKDEDLAQFRKRVMDTLKGLEIQVEYVDYDEYAVNQFWKDADSMHKDRKFNPNPNENCKYCEYAHICKLENDKPKRVIRPRSEIKL